MHAAKRLQTLQHGGLILQHSAKRSLFERRDAHAGSRRAVMAAFLRLAILERTTAAISSSAR